MTSHFTQPENALKRANEYIGVGDKASALQTLHSILGTKKHHAKDKAGQKVLEKVMLKYLDLCVEMRRGQMAKDGIHQYKYILKLSKGTPQAQHASCLEIVIRHFLSKAEKALADAHAKSSDKVIDVADLDEEESSLSQSAGGKEKQVGVTAWMRFLWESYRIVLEILRNIPKLEELYSFTAQQAFGFCHTFNRSNEFRRLSEILRNHLQALTKASNNNNQHQQGVSLNNPETVQLLLEIRFAQLNVATKMGLWQESFRSVEDVHGLITLSKKTPPPDRMCLYYEKLTQIFWQSKNYLFHAYSCIKYFKALQKVKPDMTTEQKGALGSQVLLAALSIPVTAEGELDLDFDFDVQKEKNYRLANLLGLSSPLPRNALIADLVNKGILEIAYPELVEFYKLTESKFSPLTFNVAVCKHLEFIRGRGELKVYADAVAANCFRRLMQRLAPFFQTVKLARLAALAKFISPEEVEQLIIDSVSRGLFSVRIDHRVGVVRFSSDRLDSDDMKSCLSSMSSRLETTVQSFESTKKQQVACKQRVFATAMASLEDEHTSILIRKAFIEKRKEAEEEKNRRRKLEEEQRRAEEALEQKKQEERKAEQMKQRQEEISSQIQKAKVELIQKEVEESKNQESVKVQLEKLKEEKEGMNKRLKSLTKKLDHLERARRQEERPLLDELFQNQLKEDAEYHKEQFQKTLEERRNRHQQQLEVQARIMEILPHRERFEGTVAEGRKKSFGSVLEKEQNHRGGLQKRLDETLEKQKGLFAKKEGLEVQRRKIDEEIRRRREEAEEKKRKENEEKERVRQEKQAALDRQAELQRKREQEIRERQEAKNRPAEKPSEKWRPKGSESDGEGKWGRSGSRVEEGGKWKKNSETEGGWAGRREEQPRTQAGGPPASEGTWKSRNRDRDESGQSEGPGDWRDRQNERQKSGGGGGGSWRDRQNERRDDRPRYDERRGDRRDDRPRDNDRSQGNWKSQRSQDSSREGGWTTVGSKKPEGRWGAKKDEGQSSRERW